ncbi:unnamed protein product [Rotaria socialis]|uniref:EGF-like domain-containing protein n=1 Tax=Rotaria socialis TaxID=392032 RepID=A0A818SGZ6_9BILA|nr:unnamed protein product [Rotaria socialis]
MLPIKVVCLLLLLFATLSFTTAETFDALYSRVQRYMPVQPRPKALSDEETLSNSNKIGRGYNLLTGNPVCYTGTCQMEGFARPIFELNYNKKAQGTCTKALIPDNVDIDCLPSVEVQAGTEIISTLEQLQKTNGQCKPSGYFQFGECQCNDGWTGLDCSTSKPKPVVLSGTLCGLESDVACDGQYPANQCSNGWEQTGKPAVPPTNYYGCGIPPFPVVGNGNQCAKSETNSATTGIGTICGYVNYGLTVLCDGRNPYSDACPIGYQRSSTASQVFFCYKTDPSVADLPGTMCGRTLHYAMSVKHKPDYRSVTELACGGYYPGRSSCPPNYTLRYGRDHRHRNPRICGGLFIDTRTEIWFCSKN